MYLVHEGYNMPRERRKHETRKKHRATTELTLNKFKDYTSVLELRINIKSPNEACGVAAFLALICDYFINYINSII